MGQFFFHLVFNHVNTRFNTFQLQVIHDIVHPAGIFDSGLGLLNQNVNGCAHSHTYVNHNRTVAEQISIKEP